MKCGLECCAPQSLCVSSKPRARAPPGPLSTRSLCRNPAAALRPGADQTPRPGPAGPHCPGHLSSASRSLCAAVHCGLGERTPQPRELTTCFHINQRYPPTFSQPAAGAEGGPPGEGLRGRDPGANRAPGSVSAAARLHLPVTHLP